MINGRNLGKKSQGSTITWMVAFVIIFFLIFLFVLATLVLAGKKSVTAGADKVELIEANSGRLEMHRNLVNLLNAEARGRKIREFIVGMVQNESLKGELEEFLDQEIEGFFRKKGDFNYLLVVSSLEELEGYGMEMFSEEAEFTNFDSFSEDLFFSGHSEKIDLLGRGTNLILFEDKKIILRFYFEEKNEN